MLNVIRGDVGGDDVTEMLSLRSKVIVFVSSTFTDTMAERNTLMKGQLSFVRACMRVRALVQMGILINVCVYVQECVKSL